MTRRMQLSLLSLLALTMMLFTPMPILAAQETFIKAYRAIHTYKGTAKFSSWLFRIAYNTFLNDERSRLTEVEFDETQHVSAESTSRDSDIKSYIDKALQLLSIRQQAIFDLHYKKGMTHSEIVDTLQLPLGTVKSDLRRGLEILKQRLEDWRRS
jgi:RNA polymerase sigma factor (sigma-70 family)